MNRASSALLSGGSRVVEVAWSVVVGNLVVIVLYDLATLFPPVGEDSGWGLLSSMCAAAVAGALAGWVVISTRGGTVGLALLALLVVLEAALSAQVLSGVGRGYASWVAEDLPRSAWGVRWAGLLSAVCVALFGRLRMEWSDHRADHATDGAAVHSSATR